MQEKSQELRKGLYFPRLQRKPEGLVAIPGENQTKSWSFIAGIFNRLVPGGKFDGGFVFEEVGGEYLEG